MSSPFSCALVAAFAASARERAAERLALKEQG
jgi:hypothetical protein